MKNETKVERKSDREAVITRTFNGPVHIVWEAWTKPELFQRWWVPKSSGLTLVSCEQDIRVGGKYKLVFRHPAAPEPFAFFGTYKEVTPNTRLVWTNEENGGGQVTTVTFEEIAGKTKVVVLELYPSKEALDEAHASGSASGMLPESFDQLEEFLAA
jgi:uncharacterized protein YndB with AHSA1/START domain